MIIIITLRVVGEVTLPPEMKRPRYRKQGKGAQSLSPAKGGSRVLGFASFVDSSWLFRG